MYHSKTKSMFSGKLLKLWILEKLTKEILKITLYAESAIISASLSDVHRNHNYFEPLLGKIQDQANCTLTNIVSDK